MCWIGIIGGGCLQKGVCFGNEGVLFVDILGDSEREVGKCGSTWELVGGIFYLYEMRLFNLFKRRPKWEIGTCRGKVARRHRKKGNVQFVLWKAGEQGHKEDYWHDFDSGWWGNFEIVGN